MNKHVSQTETKEATTTLNHAVCAVMEQLERLRKGDRNDHGNYAFTSVDDFKDQIRPLMAKAGLSVHVSQASFQMLEYKNGNTTKSAAEFDFAITLKHVSGEKDEPENMTVILPYTGAQTSGAARSYAIKEWQKSRFLASSGDVQDEADMLEQSREGMRLSKAGANELYESLQKEMREIVLGTDHKALKAWWIENSHRTETLPKDWFITLKTEFISEGKRLKAEAELDAKTSDELDQLGMDAEEKANV